MTAPIKGAAKVASDGKITQLGAKAAPDEVVTENDVKEPAKLAKLLARVLSTLAALRRTWSPRRLDFEDVAVINFTAYSFQHNFNGRVRWYPIDWVSAVATAPTFLKDETNTTTNTLVLTAYITGTVCIRIEEAG